MKTKLISLLLIILVVASLLTAFDDINLIIKGFFYALILVYGSYVDIRTKTIPDRVHVLILLVSLIKINLISSILGFLIVPLPFFITALLKGGGIGGGDVKFMAASGFFLAIKGGFIASIIGLLLALCVNAIVYKVKNKDKNISFPLAPYLSIGCFLSYLILGGF
ncbi:prepilin peptidase [Clostridium manihotivorum]|uniref:Prepilin peptidase n=1 Tax=Clostridium manihotivorum TaxID=2320868 RepID=A0A410DUL6_9CLOT|nr:prepilin peptidase [Clostridium manihotivorum]QAA32740.1 prepilin peptidase [Clostridium manihotivorum]